MWTRIHHITHLLQELPDQSTGKHADSQCRFKGAGRVSDQNFIEEFPVGDGTLSDVALGAGFLLGFVDEF